MLGRRWVARLVATRPSRKGPVTNMWWYALSGRTCRTGKGSQIRRGPRASFNVSGWECASDLVGRFGAGGCRGRWNLSRSFVDVFNAHVLISRLPRGPTSRGTFNKADRQERSAGSDRFSLFKHDSRGRVRFAYMAELTGMAGDHMDTAEPPSRSDSGAARVDSLVDAYQTRCRVS